MKWIFRYLRGTSKICLAFQGSKLVLEDFIDANMTCDLDGRKLISGYLVTFAGEAVS